MAATGEALKSEPATVRIFEASEDLARAAAEECVRLAVEAVKARGRFSIALAGGSTPKRLYALLASESENSFRARFPWKETHFFWGTSGTFRLTIGIVSGKDKSEALRVLRGEFQHRRFPAQLIRPVQGSLQWLADRDAAFQL